MRGRIKPPFFMKIPVDVLPRFSTYSFYYIDLWIKFVVPRGWYFKSPTTIEHPYGSHDGKYYIYTGYWHNENSDNLICINKHLDRRYFRELNRVLNDKKHYNKNNYKIKKSFELFD